MIKINERCFLCQKGYDAADDILNRGISGLRISLSTVGEDV